MSKIIYTVLLHDEATNDTSIICALSSEKEAAEFVELYIVEEYGTALDMRMSGIDMSIEPTILQTS